MRARQHRRRAGLGLTGLGLTGLGLTGPVLALALAMAVSDTAAKDPAPQGADFPLAHCATLQRPSSPNTWLAAAQGPCAAIADEPAPEFPVSAARQAAAWMAWLALQPRVAVVWRSADGLQIEATDRTPVFGFEDRISIAILPVTEDRSTVAVYSRSEVGYWDLGTNRSRVRAWLRGVAQRLSGGGG